MSGERPLPPSLESRQPPRGRPARPISAPGPPRRGLDSRAVERTAFPSFDAKQPRERRDVEQEQREKSDRDGPASAEESRAAAGEGASLRDEVVLLSARLAAQAKEREREAKLLKKAAQGLTPLTKAAAWAAPGKLGKLVAQVEKGLGAEVSAAAGLDGVFSRIREDLARGPERARREFSRGLQEACRTRGLELSVVSREPPVELRLAPFSLVVDFDKARAEVRYARELLVSCPATVEAVLDAHAKAWKGLERAFVPADFFRVLRRAYGLALAEQGKAEGERVEILDLLPLVALGQQSKKFRVNPTSENYRPYSKAQLSYDVSRLMRQAGLTQGGLRLNLGVATGATAYDKSRVLYIEDGRGGGEFKLTLFFTKAEPEAQP